MAHEEENLGSNPSGSLPHLAKKKKNASKLLNFL
jgi:hypothetical protein